MVDEDKRWSLVEEVNKPQKLIEEAKTFEKDMCVRSGLVAFNLDLAQVAELVNARLGKDVEMVPFKRARSRSCKVNVVKGHGRARSRGLSVVPDHAFTTPVRAFAISPLGLRGSIRELIGPSLELCSPTFTSSTHLWFKILEGISGVKSLSLSCSSSANYILYSLSLPTFPNLKRLDLSLENFSKKIPISQIIERSPELEHLNIETVSQILGFPSISLMIVSGQIGTLVGQGSACNRGCEHRLPSAYVLQKYFVCVRLETSGSFIPCSVV
ncbi:putative gypsy type transposase [Tanacetum coccineum]